MPGAAEETALARLAAAKGEGTASEPDMSNFVADLKVLPDVDEISDEDVPHAERENAELCRSAMIVAATRVVDWCIDDIELVMFDDEGQADEVSAEDSFVFDVFPDRHRRS